MSPDSKTAKSVFLISVTALLLSTVSAASLSLEDDTVWKNGEKDRLEATVTGSDAGDLNITASWMNETNLVTGAKKVNRSDFPLGRQVGEYTLKLYDNRSQLVTERNISLKEFSVEIENNGTGYVSEKLGKPPNTDPLVLDIIVKAKNNEEVGKESIDRDNFNVLSREARFTDEKDVNAVQEDDGKTAEVTLNPKIVEAHPQEEKLVLMVEYSHQGSKVKVRKNFNPQVYSRQGVTVGETPPILLEYSDIGSFAYNVDIREDGKDATPKLYEEDFDLEILNLETDDKFEPDGGSTQWLEVREVSGGNADYRLTLNNIPQLDTGTYRFTTRLKDPDSGEFTTIDRIRVRKGLKLSGRVVNSNNIGVRTEMTLKKGGTVIPINTGADGNYFKELDTSKGDNKYDSVNLKFFERGRTDPDATITANAVDFAQGEQENLAGDSESIKFEYWENPSVQKQAIKPVNMMAVKFAYPIAESGHKASMKFDPSNINTDNLRVFECSNWNFQGKNCLGDWSQVSGVTVSYQSNTANFPIENPYKAENSEDSKRNILLNAYVVGVPSELRLVNSINIGSPEVDRVSEGVPTGSKIRVSGTIESENGNVVEGADVEVGFFKGDREVHSLDTVQTDITGGFTAKGSAPDEPGNFSVKVSANKENYMKLETEFENRFSTFVKEGLEIKAGSEELEEDDFSVELVPGEEKTVSIEIKNVGQTDMQDVSLSFSEMDEQYYSVSDSSLGEIEAGESEKVDITFSIPGDYSSTDWPALQVSVKGKNSEGEEFEDELQNGLQTQVTQSGSESSDDEGGSTSSKESSSKNQSSNTISGAFTESITGIDRATGDFLASQSSLNLALGLIMIFTMVLAGAVKKKKEDDEDERRNAPVSDSGNGSRPNVQKPEVNGNSGNTASSSGRDEVDEAIDQMEEHMSGEDVDQKIDEIAGTDQEQEAGESSEPSSNVCGTCGEEFDTPSGRKLHEQVMH